MKTRTLATLLLTAAAAAPSPIAGCSGSNNPSTTNESANSSAGASTAATPAGGSSSSSAASTSSASSASAPVDSGAGAVGDAGADAAIAACPSGLEDKVTTCTATDLQQCVKGCGPDLPPDSGQSDLGTKVCTCTAGTYVCADCSYIDPLPACYVESATPLPCEAGVADKLACSTPCTTGTSTGNDVCTTVSDAGKSEGCVCITGSAGDVWTCATLPW